MRFLICAAMAVALMAVSTRAAADPTSVPAPGTFKPSRKGQEPPKLMTEAATVEGSMPDNIALTVGEKRSFKAGCAGAWAVDSAVVQLRVHEKGIVTVRGLKKGETNITLIGKAGQAPKAGDFKQAPTLIKVKVRD
jgi:hypothetical protein